MKSTTSRFALVILLFSVLFYSCSNEDDNNPDEVDFSALIEALTDGSSKTWKIQSAQLTNDNTNDTDGLFLSDTYNLNDDEFVFSSSSDSQVDLYWRQGFSFNNNAGDIGSFLSDIRVSPSQIVYQIGNAEDPLVDPSRGSIIRYFEETNIIELQIIYPNNALMKFTLTPKLSEDYHTPPNSINQLTEVFSTSPAVFAAGFKVSQTRQQIYLSNLGWPGDPAERDPFVLRYDLSNQQEISRTFFDEDDVFMHIELVEEGVLNLGGRNHQLFDYSLESQINYSVPDLLFSYGTTAYNNDIYVFGGWLTSPNQSGIVGKVEPGSSQLEILTNLPKARRDSDGEIIDDLLYVFGGRPAEDGEAPGSDDLFVYDLNTGSIDQLTMPIKLTWVRTAVKDAYIYVTGLLPIDADGDGTFEDNRYYLGVYDTVSGDWQEIGLDAAEFQDNIISNIYIADNKLYMVVWKNTPVVGERLTTVYTTDL